MFFLLFIILAGFFHFSRGNHSPTSSKKPTSRIVNPIQVAQPQTVGLIYQVSSDKHSVQFTIQHSSDISYVTYALTYLTTGEVRKGVVGDITVPAGQTTVTSPAIPFGSCKHTNCTYDTDIHQAQLILTITKTSGEKFQVTESII